MNYLESGDGFIENLYPYLWFPDPLQQQVPQVRIPDTIIFKNNHPFVWYFSLKGYIKKKSKKYLNSEAIIQHFTKHYNGFVMALFIEKSKADYGPKLLYHYFDLDQFQIFMNDYYTIKQGILQRFILSKGDRYNIIRCNWSPHLAIFEKLQNRWLMNARVDLYQKVTTFEEPNAPVEITKLMGKELTYKLEHQAFSIVQHIRDVSIDKIEVGRMILNFVIDPNDKLYFLACTSIRLVPKKKSYDYHQRFMPLYDTNAISLPLNIDKQSLISLFPQRLKKEFPCAHCNEDFNEGKLYPLSVKDIVKAYQLREKIITSENNDKEEFSIDKKVLRKRALLTLTLKKNNTQTQIIELQETYGVPYIINRIMPNLSKQQYDSLLDNPAFLETEVKVCQDCYFKHYEKALNIYTLESLVNRLNTKVLKLKRPNAQMPENTKHRYESTRKRIMKANGIEDLSFSSKCIKSISHSPSYRKLMDRVGFRINDSFVDKSTYLRNNRYAPQLTPKQQYQINILDCSQENQSNKQLPVINTHYSNERINKWTDASTNQTFDSIYSSKDK